MQSMQVHGETRQNTPVDAKHEPIQNAPVDADIGEELVLGEASLNLASTVTPCFELLHYPGCQTCGQLATRV